MSVVTHDGRQLTAPKHVVVAGLQANMTSVGSMSTVRMLRFTFTDPEVLLFIDVRLYLAVEHTSPIGALTAVSVVSPANVLTDVLEVDENCAVIYVNEYIPGGSDPFVLAAARDVQRLLFGA